MSDYWHTIVIWGVFVQSYNCIWPPSWHFQDNTVDWTTWTFLQTCWTVSCFQGQVKFGIWVCVCVCACTPEHPYYYIIIINIIVVIIVTMWVYNYYTLQLSLELENVYQNYLYVALNTHHNFKCVKHPSNVCILESTVYSVCWIKPFLLTVNTEVAVWE